MIFVDAGAWFALSVPSDADHAAARRFVEINREPLVTTDYAIDELLTLFRVRRKMQRATLWLDEVYLAGGFDLVCVSPVDFDRALGIFRGYTDKQWSFTDCTSLAVMERLAVVRAFSFDEHFRQFGSFTVFP